MNTMIEQMALEYIKNSEIVLTEEQNTFIQKAKEGHDILVDACIGSGKTTAIQYLCNELPESKSVLYLTYNKLLKIDAKGKIKNKNVTVTNYHGFACSILRKINIPTGISDSIQIFLQEKPVLSRYDVLIIDEYQDIEQEMAEMLEYIKSSSPGVQIIAVGDMQQKIYDKTTLNVPDFIEKFLTNYIKLEFTQCFRLSKDLAEKLGRIWGKKIVGVNNDCKVESMNLTQVTEFLAQQQPGDILCLGTRGRELSNVLNSLETLQPEKFNKKTTYASIRDTDDKVIIPKGKNIAIFTTYDSAKGLERDICVVFDFTKDNWEYRLGKSMQKYEILRNIFCVAASRGKKHIIFVEHGGMLLSEKTLSTYVEDGDIDRLMSISDMFEFKYKEDIEKCYDLLEINRLQVNDYHEIIISTNDNLIDLSPCIGSYQEMVFFQKYDIDEEIKFIQEVKKLDHYNNVYMSKQKKVLFLTFLETDQERYIKQVDVPFISDEATNEIKDRLGEEFYPNEKVQVRCKIDFQNEKGEKIFSALGLSDVVKNDVVYELKFVSELTHEHFLQCAAYVVALGLEKGILWNVRKNEKYEITIPDRNTFLDAVVNTISKNKYKKYYKKKLVRFAVIDIETNFENKMMSLGAVISDSDKFRPVSSKYYIIKPEASTGGMYSASLQNINKEDTIYSNGRSELIADLLLWMDSYKIGMIFAYNASFDRKYLPELCQFNWFDIMKLARNRHRNPKIPINANCTIQGNLKCDYGVESMYRLVSGNESFNETHNALQDALHELEIMRLIGADIEDYSFTLLQQNDDLFTNQESIAEEKRTVDEKSHKDFRDEELSHDINTLGINKELKQSEKSKTQINKTKELKISGNETKPSPPIDILGNNVIANANDSLKNLQYQISQAERRFKHIASRIDEFRALYDKKSKLVSEAIIKYEQVSQRLSEAENKLKDVTKQANEAEQKYKLMSEQLATAKREFVVTEKELKKTKMELDTVLTAFFENNLKNEKLCKNIIANESELSVINNKIQIAEKNLEKEVTHKSELDQEFRDLDMQITQKKKEYTDLRKKTEEAGISFSQASEYKKKNERMKKAIVILCIIFFITIIVIISL